MLPIFFILKHLLNDLLACTWFNLILKIFFIDLGSHSAVLRARWLWAQVSLLVVFRELYSMPEIEHRLNSCEANILPSVLLLQQQEIVHFNKNVFLHFSFKNFGIPTWLCVNMYVHRLLFNNLITKPIKWTFALTTIKLILLIYFNNFLSELPQDFHDWASALIPSPVHFFHHQCFQYIHIYMCMCMFVCVVCIT